MSRDTFLTRVRQAAQMGRAYRVHLHDVPTGTGYVGAAKDLCAAMASEVEAVGGVAHVVDSRETARQALQSLLEQYQPASALGWQHPLLDRLGVAELLDEAGITLHRYETLVKLDESERRSLALAAGIGISSADVAIAETGTLMVCARPGQERIASLLPPVHVAVIEQSQIVADLFDAFAQLAQRGLDNLPSNTGLITGPSKTGDIELQLTTGVHGPGMWHVIVIRSPEPS